MVRQVSHTQSELDTVPISPQHNISHTSKKGDIYDALHTQASHPNRGSSKVQPIVPGVPLQNPFVFHAEHADPHTPQHADNHAHVSVDHHASAPVANHFADSHHVTQEEPKKGFFARMKNKISGWFGYSKKEEHHHEIQHHSSESENIQVGNKGFEVRQGKWYNKLFANTIGRVNGVLTHTLLTFRPQDGLKNPDMDKIKDILSRYSDVNRDTDHTIYLGHTDRWDQIKKMFKRRKGFMNAIINSFYAPFAIVQSVGANLMRADHYNPMTKSLSIYSPNKWIAAHEVGHAADFAQHWDFREYQKRGIPFFGTLYSEKRASTNAIARTHNGEEKKEAEKVLYPAYGSYIGGGIGAAVTSVLGYLGFKRGNQVAKQWAEKLGKLIFSPFVLGGIALGHINARLPNFMKLKLFDRQNSPTSGDSTSTQAHTDHTVPHHTPHHVDDHTVADLKNQVASQAQENHDLHQQLAESQAALEQHIAHSQEHPHTEAKGSDDKHPEKESHPEKEEKKDHEHTKEHNKATDLMKKDADVVRGALIKTLSKDYDISWDEMPKGMQKLSATDKHNEKRSEGEIVVTVYEPGKVRIKYNPYDHYEEFYYYVETDISALDTYVSAIEEVISKKHDIKSLVDAGMEKVETKSSHHTEAQKKDDKHHKEEKHPKKEEKKQDHEHKDDHH